MNNTTRMYLHHLRDTLILLGAGTRFADLAEKPETATEQDINDLRNLNMRLIDAMKDKFVNMSKLAVEVVQPIGEREF